MVSCDERCNTHMYFKCKSSFENDVGTCCINKEWNLNRQTDSLSSLKPNGTISYRLYRILYAAYTVWAKGISSTYVFFQRFYAISFGIRKWYEVHAMAHGLIKFSKGIYLQ